MAVLESIQFWMAIYAAAISIFAAVRSTTKLRHLWKTRFIRRIWGIKNGDQVVLVCSELDNPDVRQLEEPREFIYSLKYGDLDAYIETITCLLRLFPKVRLRVMSSGEANVTRLDTARHLVMIGGPDYNALTERVLQWGKSHYSYRSPHVETRSETHPDEIVVFQTETGAEFCHTTNHRDYGYFERFPNPNNPSSQVILVGGCHTLGVTGAAKAFSAGLGEDGEIPVPVLRNAKLVAKKVKDAEHFSVLVEAERIGQTISIPVIKAEHIEVVNR